MAMEAGLGDLFRGLTASGDPDDILDDQDDDFVPV